MKIYNTLAGEKSEFKAVHRGRVGIYVCGPTTYDYAHVGHARVAIMFDIFRRFLEYVGYDVVYVSNITDIDDKIINRAKERNIDPIEMAHFYAREYMRDMKKLRVREPNIIPKATKHIDEIIELVKKLVEKGYAYEVDGDVYFSVEKFKDYGKLSHRKLKDMLAGARVEINEKKNNPLDFALWKKSKENEPSWPSPWGNGRPGWHIECSAMSMKYIGETLDIHGGGSDLIFPHHENEIAQSEAATGKNFVNYWMHVGLVNFEKEKMSKSLGNVFLVRELLKKYPPEAIRLMFINTHYRKPFDFNLKNLEDSVILLEKIWKTYKSLKTNSDEGDGEYGKKISKEYEEMMLSALNDDFNTREALKYYIDFISKVRNLKGGDAREVLNFLERWDEIFDILPRGGDGGREEELIDLIIGIREELRKEKKYKLADKIREDLLNMGIKIEDAKDGARWVYIR